MAEYTKMKNYIDNRFANFERKIQNNFICDQISPVHNSLKINGVEFKDGKICTNNICYSDIYEMNQPLTDKDSPKFSTIRVKYIVMNGKKLSVIDGKLHMDEYIETVDNIVSDPIYTTILLNHDDIFILPMDGILKQIIYDKSIISVNINDDLISPTDININLSLKKGTWITSKENDIDNINHDVILNFVF